MVVLSTPDRSMVRRAFGFFFLMAGVDSSIDRVTSHERVTGRYDPAGHIDGTIDSSIRRLLNVSYST